MIFVRNAWYMFGWARELGEAPVARRILGDDIVMFRSSDGELAALADACPHRAVPLSLGTVAAGRLRCPYHGLEFDGGGVCRHNPHIAGPPDRLKVRAYPVVERYGGAWVWTGDAALADPAAIVALDWFDEETFTVCSGALHIEADYRLVIDNLMDLAHAEYIHAGTVGTPGASDVAEARLTTEADVVTVRSFLPDMPPTALFAKVWDRTERIDKYADIGWHSPSVLTLDLGVMAPGAPRAAGIRAPSTHILTPESERSTHYFWALSRDFARDCAAVSTQIAATIARAFNEEDKPMLEAAQRVLDRTDVLLTNFSVGDAGSAQVRRRLARAVEAERAGERAA